MSACKHEKVSEFTGICEQCENHVRPVCHPDGTQAAFIPDNYDGDYTDL